MPILLDISHINSHNISAIIGIPTPCQYSFYFLTKTGLMYFASLFWRKGYRNRFVRPSFRPSFRHKNLTWLKLYHFLILLYQTFKLYFLWQHWHTNAKIFWSRSHLPEFCPLFISFCVILTKHPRTTQVFNRTPI